MGDFDHIREAYRAKVASDFLEHLDQNGQWDFALFNPLNDYQRHLHALFLRLAGRSRSEVVKAINLLSTDVSESKKLNYCMWVVHSEIVGFPMKDGSLIEIPNQAAARMEFPSLA